MRNIILETNSMNLFNAFKIMFDKELNYNILESIEKTMKSIESTEVKSLERYILLDDILICISNEFISKNEPTSLITAFNPLSLSYEFESYYISTTLLDDLFKAYRECKKVTSTNSYTNVLFNPFFRKMYIAFQLNNSNEYIVYSTKSEETSLKIMNDKQVREFTFFSR